MRSVKVLLEELDSTLRKFNRVNYDSLRDPLPEEEIVLKMDQLECHDDDLKAWFSWKTGTGLGPEDGMQRMTRRIFAYNSFPLSLDAIIEQEELDDEEPFWDYWFMPITADQAGQYYLFNNQEGEDYGKIYLYSASLLITEPEMRFSSLRSMLETTIAAYEEGVIRLGEDGGLDTDYKKYRELSAKFNANPQ